MKNFGVFALLALIVSGCAMDATVRSKASELPGTYYSGDHLGRNVTVVLEPDGTYSSEWDGCLGFYGKSIGVWQVRGESLEFSPLSAESDLAGYLTQATTIQHDGRLGFARSQDIKHDRVNERLLFLKQESSP